jgi:hypothetical protein
MSKDKKTTVDQQNPQAKLIVCVRERTECIHQQQHCAASTQSAEFINTKFCLKKHFVFQDSNIHLFTLLLLLLGELTFKCNLHCFQFAAAARARERERALMFEITAERASDIQSATKLS